MLKRECSRSINSVGLAVAGAGALWIGGCERRGGLALTLESPRKTYLVSISGRLAAPTVPLIEHYVRVSAYRGSVQVVQRHEVDIADWFDDGFRGKYGPVEWPKENVLRFVSRIPSKARHDVIRIENRSGRAISFLKVMCLDLFLLFEVPAGSVTSFETTAQRAERSDLSWIEVDGEWSSGASLRREGRNFDVARGWPGYQYVVSISEKGVTLGRTTLP